MKNFILLAILIFTNIASAYEIEGTLVLKGSLKTNVYIRGIKTTCKVKVSDVKNLMKEDQYGNPAYKLKVDVSLSGGEFLSPTRIKFDEEYLLTNLFEAGVKDLEYSGSRVYLVIHPDGRLNQIKFQYKNNPVICKF